jgi:miniconductance mechanosensitive channel
MGSLESLRDQSKQILLSWLQNTIPDMSDLVFDGLVVLWIALSALILHFCLHVLLRRLLVGLTDNKGDRWQKMLLRNSLFHRIFYVIQGGVVHVQAGLWFDESSFLLKFIEGVADHWILLFGLLAFFSVLDTFQTIVTQGGSRIRFPFRGLIQTIKLISSLLVGLLAISTLIGKSPLILFSGLGALSAILLLVFKDPILGLVAGIQLSANRMLSVGDWLEMPKYGADGDVIDIALTTVKVQNWDKTITTIPTYALITDSFKNWRGMSESGGRRIIRSILIDTSSIRFLDESLLNKLNKADLLGTYLAERIKTIEHENINNKSDMSIFLNGRRLTNIGTFRQYLLTYLQTHAGIHQNMTLMVRQLQSTSDGLPIQLYAFTNTTSWTKYEDIQSDIFDHVFAVLPEFDLRAHESPTGFDIRSLSARQSEI